MTISLPDYIPSGTRIVVRIKNEINPLTHRQQYSDFLGHVESWDRTKLVLRVQPHSGKGSKESLVEISAEKILIIKPIPERKF